MPQRLTMSFLARFWHPFLESPCPVWVQRTGLQHIPMKRSDSQLFENIFRETIWKFEIVTIVERSFKSTIICWKRLRGVLRITCTLSRKSDLSSGIFCSPVPYTHTEHGDSENRCHEENFVTRCARTLWKRFHHANAIGKMTNVITWKHKTNYTGGRGKLQSVPW